MLMPQSQYNPHVQPQQQYIPSQAENQPTQTFQFQDMTNQVTRAANKRKAGGNSRNTRAAKTPRTTTTTITASAPAENATPTSTIESCSNLTPVETEPALDQPLQALSMPSARVTGVGPISHDSAAESMAFQKDTHFGSLVRTPKNTPNANAATDVWYFIRALKSAKQPDSLPRGVEVNWMTRPPRKEYSRVISSKLINYSAHTPWHNSDGQTKTLRTHLSEKHGQSWREIVLIKQLKGWEALANGLPQEDQSKPRPSFTLEGFYERLLRWIAVDDQSLNVVDCPELRDLLLFIGTDLADSDIPHRTKLSELIVQQFQKEYTEMINIKNSLGRLSWTSDIWSRTNLESYMAVTVHYIVRAESGHIELRSRLVAFRRIESSHTGANIAGIFMSVLKDLGAQNSIGMITLDNASNNGTFVKELSDALHDLGIDFDINGNRVRCFPHVINIAVKFGLKHLSASLPGRDVDPDLDSAPDWIPSSDAILQPNASEYYYALQDDVIAAARKVVNAIRASDGRREMLQDVIKELNEIRHKANQIPSLQLLRDVDTRWSCVVRLKH
ncbi:hypothetical protein D9758_013794 [Tetrapyrgos nigripes]|uniref:Uncharacterized protein n=1 Tax=Tetrapyrgos nigripes TaxID=182062 RepID=A0A8H5D5M7_9AGAR|nr:hypothetical protein D9758_013794 [Tetrapyrgos nigripes]